MNKPKKIIGLTAHLEDLNSFRAEFQRYCLTVVEATAGSDVWKKTVRDTLSYTASSKLARAQGEVSIHVVTVHGIRTFGHWQTRFKNLVARVVKGIEFHSYKYGYFSVLAYVIPPFRWFEVRQLANRLSQLFHEHSKAEFVIFCHSFGTLLVAKALERLVANGEVVPLRTVVLAGSVLPRRFNWEFLPSALNLRVVNDCCDKDYFLLATEAFVLGTGMAGKCGFVGFEGPNLRNRFFPGRHSGYFADAFMLTHWVPLLNGTDQIAEVDERIWSFVNHECFDKICGVLGMLKPIIYITLFAAIGFKLL